MELEHRFEVPVGIDLAWTHLLDMEKVAACFPGATLASADGAEYTGTVKVKLGPIQLTYAGSARIVSADAATHTATIEASGSAARSGSTAAMTVVATATALGDDSTAVLMKTDLSITGRPAQFGRGVMVEVGNKILGRFADCLSTKLAASSTESDTVELTAAESSMAEAAAAETTQADSAGESGADGVASKAGTTASKGSGSAAGPGPSPHGSAGAGPATFTRAPVDSDSVEPIDLLESARGSIIKRAVPPVVAFLVFLVYLCVRRRRR
ncbi:MAG: SRPBCC family protein [Nakamurella sp.]